MARLDASGVWPQKAIIVRLVMQCEGSPEGEDVKVVMCDTVRAP